MRPHDCKRQRAASTNSAPEAVDGWWAGAGMEEERREMASASASLSRRSMMRSPAEAEGGAGDGAVGGNNLARAGMEEEERREMAAASASLSSRSMMMSPAEAALEGPRRQRRL